MFKYKCFKNVKELFQLRQKTKTMTTIFKMFKRKDKKNCLPHNIIDI